jgi:hypothetical protein
MDGKGSGASQECGAISTFYEHLLLCNPTLNPNFLKEIQVHYNTNFEPKMLMKKLKMLVYSFIFLE